MESAEGKDTAFGRVSAIRNLGSSYVYTLLSTTAQCIESARKLSIGECVGIRGNGTIIEEGDPHSCPAYDETISRMLSKADLQERFDSLSREGLSSEDVLRRTSKRMLPSLSKAAILLLRTAMSGAPIIVRFHGDGDGACGAIALYKALARIQEKTGSRFDIKWFSNRGISYSMNSFYYDSMHFRNYESMERPLVCIIDFGTTLESNEAIDAASGKFNFVWLDHHPPVEGFLGHKLEHYVNPSEFKGTSDFSAGFLAGIFAQLISDVHVEGLKEASLISDFSAYASRKNRDAVKYATILDFVTGIKNSTHYLDGPITPSYLLKLISDKEKSESVYHYANEMIEDAIAMGIERAKSHARKDGISIKVIDFVPIAEKYGGYLLPGRYSSRVHGRLDEQRGKGFVTIVNFRNVVSIRISKGIAERVGILGIIERLKGSSDIVASGGGHKEAASMIAREGMSERLIKLLLRELLA